MLIPVFADTFGPMEVRRDKGQVEQRKRRGASPATCHLSHVVALTIAGSDSGGGAGIQVDLKTFAALGVHGTSAIACLTAQNPDRVLAIEPCSPGMLRRQIAAVYEELRPMAVKTGMLFSAENIRTVAAFLKKSKMTSDKWHVTRKGQRILSPGICHNSPFLVVDPVMISTSGARLLQAAAIERLKKDLLPVAALVTPNLAEACILTGRKISSIADMRSAAREIHGRFGCAALVKGGHLQGTREAADIFFDGRAELLLTAPFVKGIRTHGTGCACSAAITGYLALGFDLIESVTRAKQFITQAIAGSYRAGRHFALNPNFNAPHSR